MKGRQMTKNQYPIYASINCPGGIPVIIRNDAEWTEYHRSPMFRQSMERSAIIRHFFPKITADEQLAILLSFSDRDNIGTVYEKMKAEYEKAKAAADEAARREEVIEAARKAAIEATTARGRQNITQATAAEICGVSIKTIRRWEQGKTNPPDWYPGRAVTVIEFQQRVKQGQNEKRTQAAVKKGLKNACSLDRLKNI